MKKIIIGTRKSPLALAQTEIVIKKLASLYPQLTIQVKKKETQGDKNLDSRLSDIGGKGLFLKELEHALLDGEIDAAVHSCKDIPYEMDKRLEITATLKRESPFDAFVSLKYSCLRELPKGAIIGTCSLRRIAQILHYNNTFFLKDLRGNIQTRLEKLRKGEFDAIILAQAGLQRMNLATYITEKISPKVCLPAIGQGVLAIQTRRDDSEVNSVVKQLTHQETSICIEVERAFMKIVEGSCTTPIAAYATLQKQKLFFEALIAKEDGTKILRTQQQGELFETKKIAEKAAQILLSLGGEKILHSTKNGKKNPHS